MTDSINNIDQAHDAPEVAERSSTVGMSKTSKNVAIVGIAVLTVVALFYIFSSSNKGEKDSMEGKIEETKKIVQPVAREGGPVIRLPAKLPDLPTLIAPIEPPPHPRKDTVSTRPVISPPNINLPNQNNIVSPSLQGRPVYQMQQGYPSRPGIVETRSNRVTKNRNTPMLVISGSGIKEAANNFNLSDPTSIVSGDNLNRIKDSFRNQEDDIDENAPLERTSSDQVKATYIGDLNVIIAQGKLIDAVLETSINTDLKGMLRAIVSRDVYSESGKNILLPKGSRLIGEYDSSISGSQVRVDVVWSRVMRPDGIDLQIDSLGTDQLGRAGIRGQVDTKFGHLFMNSLLVSSLKIAGAGVVQKLFPNGASSTSTTAGGTVTNNTSVSAKIAIDAVENLTKSFETVVKQYENTKPTVRIDQGTRIKVFVNKDLVFSYNLNNKTKIMN